MTAHTVHSTLRVLQELAKQLHVWECPDMAFAVALLSTASLLAQPGLPVSLQPGSPQLPPPSAVFADVYDDHGFGPSPGVVVGAGAIVLSRHAVDGSKHICVNEGSSGYLPLVKVIYDDPANDVIILGLDDCKSFRSPAPGIMRPQFGSTVAMWTVRDNKQLTVLEGEVAVPKYPSDLDLIETTIPAQIGDSGAPVFDVATGLLVGTVSRLEYGSTGTVAVLAPAQESWTKGSCEGAETWDAWITRRGTTDLQVSKLNRDAQNSLKKGEYVAARTSGLAAIELQSSNTRAIRTVLMSFDYEQNSQAQQPFLEGLVAKSPQHRYAWIELGHARLRSKDAAGARNAYQRAAQITASAESQYWLAVATRSISGADEAAAILHEVADSYPKCVPLQRLLVQYAREAKRRDWLLLALRRVHEADPHDARSAWDYGVMLVNDGQKQEAKAIVEQLRQKNPVWANRLQFYIENSTSIRGK